MKHLLFAALIFGLSACQSMGQATLNAITIGGDYEVEKNVAYGDLPRQKLDYYDAKDPSSDDKPLIVFIHGGGWHYGSKDGYKFLAEGLTSAGYDVAMPNYRLHPEAVFPDFLEDNAKAIAKIHNDNPSRYLALIGHSAGAYNVLMMGVKPEYLQAEGIEPCYTIKGIVALAAPVGLEAVDEEPHITTFPNRLVGEDDSILKNVNGPTPPILLSTGDNDASVNYKNSVALAEKITARGGVVETKIYPGADHVEPVKQFSRYFDEDGTIKSDVIGFIEALPGDEGDGFCR